LNRRQKVELFGQIRREYEHGVGTIKGVARKHVFVLYKLAAVGLLDAFLRSCDEAA
jgi:hypothetical protein